MAVTDNIDWRRFTEEEARAAQGWWDELNDKERCWHAAKDAGASEEVLEAIAHPERHRDWAFIHERARLGIPPPPDTTPSGWTGGQ